ncbi:ankyrin [Hyaloscypha bicolor E]|uniref:Ankyrin n=1 Tax=Hyaloscypha bicolor E TaxID=1095630 RepID=A0A2J6SRZ2_9HELO|nr:ankyrin [Hyaloscypha bicolor E]PMD53546.1 ankyrin [Hyaloscypha bicolor E]
MGTTPIIKAASKAHVSTVLMLLERGADPYLENWYGNALHFAAEAGQSLTIAELVTYGMSPNACERYCRRPLSCTIDNDSASAFEILVALGADIEAIDVHRGLPILHSVAFENCLNIMGTVLKHNWGDLQRKSEKGHTPLHFVAIMGNLLMVRKLVEAGADVDVKDR